MVCVYGIGRDGRSARLTGIPLPIAQRRSEKRTRADNMRHGSDRNRSLESRGMQTAAALGLRLTLRFSSGVPSSASVHNPFTEYSASPPKTGKGLGKLEEIVYKKLQRPRIPPETMSPPP